LKFFAALAANRLASLIQTEPLPRDRRDKDSLDPDEEETADKKSRRKNDTGFLSTWLFNHQM